MTAGGERRGRLPLAAPAPSAAGNPRAKGGAAGGCWPRPRSGPHSHSLLRGSWAPRPLPHRAGEKGGRPAGPAPRRRARPHGGSGAGRAAAPPKQAGRGAAAARFAAARKFAPAILSLAEGRKGKGLTKHGPSRYAKKVGKAVRAPKAVEELGAQLKTPSPKAAAPAGFLTRAPGRGQFLKPPNKPKAPSQARSKMFWAKIFP